MCGIGPVYRMNHAQVIDMSGQCLVIGVRLGALIAACAADDHEDSVQALALWAPVLKGRLYVRELKLASASSAHATPASAPLVEGDLEAGGFVSDKDGGQDMFASSQVVAGNEAIHRALLKTLKKPVTE